MDIFKNLHSFEKRNSECGRILKKHPERIPVVVCKGDKEKTLQDIDKQKYLVPQDMQLSQFIFVIRNRIKLKPEQALFILIDHNLVPGNKQLQEIYNSYKDIDGFLYMTYSSENTFG